MLGGEADYPPASSCRAPPPAEARRTPGMTQLWGKKPQRKETCRFSCQETFKTIEGRAEDKQNYHSCSCYKNHTLVRRIVAVRIFTPPEPIAESWIFIIVQND